MSSQRRSSESLRQRARSALERGEVALSGLPENVRDDVDRLFEELRLYQAELEVQNQELRATQAQAESDRSRFELLFSGLPLPALVVDPRGSVQEINAEAEALVGSESKFHRRQKLTRVLREALDPTLVQLLRHADVDSVPVRAALNFPSASTPRQFDVHVQALPGEFHLEHHRLLVLVDCTDQEELRVRNEQMENLQRRYEIAQRATGAGIWLWNRVDDRIVWDAMCCTRLGWPARERTLTFRDWADLIHPKDLPGVLAKLNRSAPGEDGTVSITMRMRTSDGAWRWFQGRGQVIARGEGGRSSQVVGTLIDIDAEQQQRARVDELLQRLDKLSEHVPGVLYQYQQWPDGRSSFPYSSAGMREIYGFAPAELVDDATPVFEYLHPGDLTRVGNSIAESARTLTPWHDRYRVQHPEHGLIWVEGEATPEAQPDGSVLWHGIIRDITERKRLQDQVEDEHRRLGNILWGTGAGTWEWNVQTGETRFNERWAEIIGYTLEELEPVSIDTWQRFAHDDDLARSAQLLNMHFAGLMDSYECEARMRHRNGHWVWVLDRGRIITRTPDGEPEWMAGTHTDISARKEAELRLGRLAYYDNLTGLPGRALLLDRLQQAMRQARRRRQWVAAAFIDLDGFKGINDAYGHAEGDVVLQKISEGLQATVRESDTIGRLGGDEFVAVFGDLEDRADCHPQIERLLEVISRPIETEARELEISASIGVAFYPQADRVSPEELLRRADLAMYRAKARGKNGFSFDEHDLAARRLERQLLQA